MGVTRRNRSYQDEMGVINRKWEEMGVCGKKWEFVKRNGNFQLVVLKPAV